MVSHPGERVKKLLKSYIIPTARLRAVGIRFFGVRIATRLQRSQ
jgi:hypothetical protein